MKVIREQRVPVSELKSNLFVRQILDDDHVLVLMGLVANGIPIEPIEVIEDLSIVDGRHRREAYEMCEVKDVVVRVLRFDSETELITYAFRKNCGGAKPPTPADIEHTVEILLERNQSNKAIAEGLNLPPAMTRQYVQQVKDRLSRAKLMRAASAVTDGGLTVAKAAEQYGVDVEKLKEQLSGRRKKQKSNGVDDLLRQATFWYRSSAQRNANMLRKLLQQYDDGDVNAEQVKRILDHLRDLQKKQARASKEWEARFNAKLNSDSAAVA